MFCNNCGNQIRDDELFCVKCGAEATKQEKICCEICGASIKKGVNFCNVCGAEIKEKKLEKSFCQYCGEKFEKGNLFCKKCGQPLNEMRMEEWYAASKKKSSADSLNNNNVPNQAFIPQQPSALGKAFTARQMFYQHIGMGCLFFALLLLWFVPAFIVNSDYAFFRGDDMNFSIGLPFVSELSWLTEIEEIGWLWIVILSIIVIIDIVPMILAGIFAILPVMKNDYSQRIKSLRVQKFIAIKTLVGIFVWLIFYNVWLIISFEGGAFVGLGVGGVFLIIASVASVVLSSYFLSQERKAALTK